jgi:hypothetical protein
MDSLLYDYMDKFLFLFATEDFITRDVKIVEFDRHNFKIKAEAYDLPPSLPPSAAARSSFRVRVA